MKPFLICLLITISFIACDKDTEITNEDFYGYWICNDVSFKDTLRFYHTAGKNILTYKNPGIGTVEVEFSYQSDSLVIEQYISRVKYRISSFTWKQWGRSFSVNRSDLDLPQYVLRPTYTYRKL